MTHDERPKLARVTDDCFAAVVRTYLASPKFAGYEENTRALWGRELNFAARPDTLGSVSLSTIRPALVQAFLDGLDGRPGKQAAALSALKALEKWAIVRDLLPRDITKGVETGKPQGGHVPWTDLQVEIAERYASPELARVVTLGANTGQRGSDLIRMCPTDIETFQGIEGIKVVQKKTRKEVWVPITSTLAAAMATWERRPGPYLVRADGSPWDRAALSRTWDIERHKNPKLEPVKDMVLHGLRGTACVRLRRNGATPMQIADMVGMSVPMVERYCRFSAQRENAVAAVYHLERTLGERKRDMSGGGGSASR
jgi:integrase